MTAFARKVLADLPAPEPAPAAQQLSAAAAQPARLRRQVRRQDRRPDQRPDDRASCASASARTTNYYQPAHRRPVRRRAATAIVRIAQPAAAPSAYTWTVTPDLAARRPHRLHATPSPASSRRSSAAPACRTLYGIPGLPDLPGTHRRTQHAEHLAASPQHRPPGHQSAIPESDSLGIPK